MVIAFTIRGIRTAGNLQVHLHGSSPNLTFHPTKTALSRGDKPRVGSPDCRAFVGINPRALSGKRSRRHCFATLNLIRRSVSDSRGSMRWTFSGTQWIRVHIVCGLAALRATSSDLEDFRLAAELTKYFRSGIPDCACRISSGCDPPTALIGPVTFSAGPPARFLCDRVAGSTIIDPASRWSAGCHLNLSTVSAWA